MPDVALLENAAETITRWSLFDEVDDPVDHLGVTATSYSFATWTWVAQGATCLEQG